MIRALNSSGIDRFRTFSLSRSALRSRSDEKSGATAIFRFMSGSLDAAARGGGAASGAR
jgi:hypothetical protein